MFLPYYKDQSLLNIVSHMADLVGNVAWCGTKGGNTGFKI